MNTYTTLAKEGTATLVERRSEFIGYAKPVNTEEEAAAFVMSIKKKHADARHNVFAYVLRGGALKRYSDDGEPQGSAGMPVLDVICKNGLDGAAVVVTRYFGGILLGAGGLVRAYTKGAKIAVDAAGKSMKRVWTVLYVPCPYTYYERVKLEVAAFGGIIRTTDFGAEVELELLFPENQAQAFLDRLTDMTAATVEGMETGQEYRAFPIEG